MEIEKGVPIPERYPHSRFREIAEKMEIGDSVLCANSNEAVMLGAKLNNMGRAYTSRKESTERKNLENRNDLPYRVWRTK